MEDTQNSDTRAEAERLLGISEKFLTSRDLTSSRDFAVLAQETAPLLDGSDQILAITDVLLAADTKKINNQFNWYAILQLENNNKSDNNLDNIKKQYRRLALLLHPDKNKYPFANEAFQLVADAWGVLSDLGRKNVFDHEYGLFSRLNLSNFNQDKGFKGKGKGKSMGVGGGGGSETRSFWTMCPYCYNLYEYPRVYNDCCLKCVNCKKAMHAAEVPNMPPLVQGQDAYYCCWGFFPMGFTGNEGFGGGSGRKDSGFTNWAPPIFGMNMNVNGGDDDDEEFVENSGGNVNGNVTPVHRNVNVTRGSVSTSGAKRGRGRPRKNPL